LLDEARMARFENGATEFNDIVERSNEVAASAAVNAIAESLVGKHASQIPQQF
jgi:hypothetical protein